MIAPMAVAGIAQTPLTRVSGTSTPRNKAPASGYAYSACASAEMWSEGRPYSSLSQSQFIPADNPS